MDQLFIALGILASVAFIIFSVWICLEVRKIFKDISSQLQKQNSILTQIDKHISSQKGEDK